MPARLPAQNSTYTPATITSPASGSVLNDSTITFSWSGASSTTGYGITGYRVQLITTGFAGIQVTAIDQSAAAWDSSATISGLPADCSTITVRLITEFNSQYGAQWYSHDNTYIAAGPNAMATMVSPAPGSVLGGASALFRWTASASSSAGGYQLNVGTTPGGGDLFSNKLTKATDQTVNGLPTNGTPIYVRLSTLLGGVWANNDYSYVAAGGLTGSGAKLQQGTAPSITPPIIPGGTTQPAGGSGGTATKAVISSPTPGTTLGGSTVTFTWNAVSGASAYSLAVGTGPTDAKFFDQNIGLATSQTVTGLPTDGREDFSLCRLRSLRLIFLPA